MLHAVYARDFGAQKTPAAVHWSAAAPVKISSVVS